MNISLIEVQTPEKQLGVTCTEVNGTGLPGESQTACAYTIMDVDPMHCCVRLGCNYESGSFKMKDVARNYYRYFVYWEYHPIYLHFFEIFLICYK